MDRAERMSTLRKEIRQQELDDHRNTIREQLLSKSSDEKSKVKYAKNQSY